MLQITRKKLFVIGTLASLLIAVLCFLGGVKKGQSDRSSACMNAQSLFERLVDDEPYIEPLVYYFDYLYWSGVGNDEPMAQDSLLMSLQATASLKELAHKLEVMRYLLTTDFLLLDNKEIVDRIQSIRNPNFQFLLLGKIGDSFLSSSKRSRDYLAISDAIVGSQRTLCPENRVQLYQLLAAVTSRNLEVFTTKLDDPESLEYFKMIQRYFVTLPEEYRVEVSKLLASKIGDESGALELASEYQDLRSDLSRALSYNDRYRRILALKKIMKNSVVDDASLAWLQRRITFEEADALLDSDITFCLADYIRNNPSENFKFSLIDYPYNGSGKGDNNGEHFRKILYDEGDVDEALRLAQTTTDFIVKSSMFSHVLSVCAKEGDGAPN